MSAFPAYCPSCRSVFPFRGIQSLSQSITFSDCTIGCPVCGFAEARISDGSYSVFYEFVRFLSGPESTRAMLEAIQGVATKVSAGEISPVQGAKEVEDISPQFAALLQKIIGMGPAGWVLLLTIIQTILTGIQTFPSNGTQSIVDAIANQTITIKDTIEQIRAVEHEHKDLSRNHTESKTPSAKERRPDANKNRRGKLKRKRVDFGGSRSH